MTQMMSCPMMPVYGISRSLPAQCKIVLRPAHPARVAAVLAHDHCRFPTQSLKGRVHTIHQMAPPQRLRACGERSGPVLLVLNGAKSPHGTLAPIRTTVISRTCPKRQESLLKLWSTMRVKVSADRRKTSRMAYHGNRALSRKIPLNCRLCRNPT